MAHYCFIDENNQVTETITGRDESDLVDGVTSWEEYYGAMRGQTCLRTSYNTRRGVHIEGGEPFRGNYAAPGMFYYPDEDVFAGPQIYPSWTLNAETAMWEAPTPRPVEGKWEWDESAVAWVEVVEPSA